MTDDLIAALTGAPPRDKRKSCYYSKWFEQQDPELQKAITSAMENSRWKTSSLYNLIKDRGYEAQYNSLLRHRSGSCSCDA